MVADLADPACSSCDGGEAEKIIKNKEIASFE
jgi:hypothetical protein